MSGFTPIEFTKAATKEGGRTPTNEEKDADALQRVAAAFGSAPEMKADSADPGPQLIAGDASGSRTWRRPLTLLQRRAQSMR